MIVATAGHIDHGKTSLVKALTGVDTDRLPEEKRRGLSIDLGFAYPKDARATLGFVDVPGHERFVRNMIAGVTAIDCALLVIAADDGPMPQTLEHLAILDLLGVTLGAVALTKIDRVSGDRIVEVGHEIRALLPGTSLADAKVFPLSAITGEGISELHAWLDDKAAQFNGRANPGHFRMAIDRSFVIDGAGLVVTGAVSSGEAKVEDRLVLAPQGKDVRVRGIHAQNRKARQGRAGERCAINIVAPRISIKNVHRGQWLVAPELYMPTNRFDARIRLLASEVRALRHWASMHLHIGALDVPANVALLEGAPLTPGESAYAQIVTKADISTLYGDRFILRDQSGQRTMGGGSVIDPFAPARGRAKPERMALLHALDQKDPAIAARQVLHVSPAGLRFGEFICARNLDLEAATGLRKALDDVRIVGEGRDAVAFTGANWSALRQAVSKLIAASQGKATGDAISRAAMLQAMRPRVSDVILEALLGDLIEQGEIVHAGGIYKPRGAGLQLAATEGALWTRLSGLLDNLRPPSIAELATELKCDARNVERLLQKVARMGQAVQIAPNRYYLPLQLRELAVVADEVSKTAPDGLVSIRAFRDKSGVGRNLSVEALEFFDRLGFTARSGEHRRICKAIADVKWVRMGG